jgi:hypothetical protein
MPIESEVFEIMTVQKERLVECNKDEGDALQ